MAIKSSDLHKLPEAAKKAAFTQMAKSAQPYTKKGSGNSRANNYGAKRYYSELINRTFKSTGEGKWAERLWVAQQAGAISELKFEPQVKLLGVVRMRPDARYIDEDGTLVYHEYKGFADSRWKMQKKLWELAGPSEYRVTYQSGKSEIIRPAPNDDLIHVVLRFLNTNKEKRKYLSDECLHELEMLQNERTMQ